MKNKALYTSKIVHRPFGHATKQNSTVLFSWQHAHLEVLWHNDDNEQLPAPLHHNHDHHLDTSTPHFHIRHIHDNGYTVQGPGQATLSWPWPRVSLTPGQGWARASPDPQLKMFYQLEKMYYVVINKIFIKTFRIKEKNDL